MPRTGAVFALTPSTVAPAVSGTPASAADFNAAMDDISQALSDSMVTDAPAFTSPASFDGGTEDAPGITFTGDLDTGIWHPAANQVGITVDGAVTGTVLLAKTTGVDVTGALDVTGAATLDDALTVTGVITAAGGFDADTHTIDNVVDPTTDQQAATKKYVDDAVATVAPAAWTQPTGATDAVTTLLRTRKLGDGTVQFNGKITFTGTINAGVAILTTGHPPWSVASGAVTTISVTVMAFSTAGSTYVPIAATFSDDGGALKMVLPANNADVNMTIYLDDVTYYATT